ncbi:MAG TPA: multi-sensor hybrid histidine kinase, partial [Telluria sp.]|nr:multi-sensor hybrid histidine kinase [Telluria sp.]
GASAVAGLAADIEQRLQQGDSAAARPALEQLGSELARTVDAIALALGGSAAPEAVPAQAFDRGALCARLRELAGLLAQDDSGAAKLADQVLPQLRDAGQGEHARQLKRLIAQYDFEGALEQLEAAAAALDLTLEA